MNEALENRVRGLAQPLWESAARPFGMAIDFWLMAEQMVIEVMTATARMQDKAITPLPDPVDPEAPLPAPVAKVRELAHCMWESAGRQYGMAQDFWLAAERHVLAMARATEHLPRSEWEKVPVCDPATLSPAAYLDLVRRMAYYSWQAAGAGYGTALDFWLQAEKEMLARMTAAAPPPVAAAPTAARGPASPSAPTTAESSVDAPVAPAPVAPAPAVPEQAAATDTDSAIESREVAPAAAPKATKRRKSVARSN